MVQESDKRFIRPIEITRDDMEQYRPMVRVANHLSYANYSSWQQVFKASNIELQGKRLIGDQALFLIRKFQSNFEFLENESKTRGSTYKPYLVEVLPENYPVTSKNRRMIFVSRLIQIPLIDQDSDTVINMLLRAQSRGEGISGDEVSQKARGTASFEQLQEDVNFLNRLGLGFILERHQTEEGYQMELTSSDSIVRIMPKPNGAQLFAVPNG